MGRSLHVRYGRRGLLKRQGPLEKVDLDMEEPALRIEAVGFFALHKEIR